MTNKEILHRVLLGLDPYLSCGVPSPLYELAVDLTREVYGEPGVALVEQFKSEHDGSVDATQEITLYTIDGWDDPNTFVGPEELIAKLEAI